jgi:diguanylate cyclase (GGDEF)-like protein
MIYSSNGALSPYFAGVNLTLMGMSIVNGFYFWHTLGICLISIALYLTACFGNHAGFNMPHLLVGTVVMCATSLFALLMTRFYSLQHFNSFFHNEELKESERKLKILFGLADEKSKTDDLTKIYNRRYFFEILSDKIANCQMTKNCFYLIIFDIDHFKKVNDDYGHVFGDQVISTIAKTVRDMMRLNSYMGRYGGDEFMCIIDKATIEELLRRVGMISHAIRELEFNAGGKIVHLTASFGISRYDPDKGMDEKKLIELADNALLEVKRSGRGEIKLVGSV